MTTAYCDFELRKKATTTTTGIDMPSSVADLWNNGRPILTLPNHITVRHFRPTDAPIMAQYCNDPYLAINMRQSYPQPYTLADAEALIKLNLDRSNAALWQPPDASFSTAGNKNSSSIAPPAAAAANDGAEKYPLSYQICHNDIPIGGIAVKFGDDISVRTARLGYFLARAYWRRGIMAAAASAFVDWVFDTFPQIARVEAQVYDWNREASGGVLRKCGFVEEGVLRCAAFKDGRFVDLRMWARVREGCVGEQRSVAEIVGGGDVGGRG